MGSFWGVCWNRVKWGRFGGYVENASNGVVLGCMLKTRQLGSFGGVCWKTRQMGSFHVFLIFWWSDDQVGKKVENVEKKVFLFFVQVIGISCTQVICEVSAIFIFFNFSTFFSFPSAKSFFGFLKKPWNRVVLRLFFIFRQNGVISRVFDFLVIRRPSWKKSWKSWKTKFFGFWCSWSGFLIFLTSAKFRRFLFFLTFLTFSLFQFCSLIINFPFFRVTRLFYGFLEKAVKQGHFDGNRLSRGEMRIFWRKFFWSQILLFCWFLCFQHLCWQMGWFRGKNFFDLENRSTAKSFWPFCRFYQRETRDLVKKKELHLYKGGGSASPVDCDLTQRRSIARIW